MERLFSRSLDRQLRVLELIESTDGCDIKSLTSVFNVDIKTITKDIKLINEIIHPLKINRDTGLDYHLEIPQIYNFKFVYSAFLTYSVEYQLLETIIFDETHSYQSLSDKLFVSVSSLRRTILRMNELLAVDQLKIRTNPLRLVGDEVKITNFLCHYLIEKYSISDNILSAFEQEFIEKILEKIFEFKNIPMTYSYKELGKWVFISNVIRARNGNMLEIKETLPMSQEFLELFKEIPLFSYKFKEIFKLELTTDLLSRLGYVVFRPLYAATMVDLEKMRKNNSRVKQVVSSIERIIKKLQERVTLESTNPELLLRLYNVSISYYGDAYVLNDLDSMVLKELKRKWPLFFKDLEEEYYQENSILEEKSFSSFAFYLFIEWPELTKYLRAKQKKLKIGLFCTTIDSHMVFLENELTMSLPNQLEFEILKTNSFREIKEKEIDVIVTNVNNLNSSVPTVCISRYLSNRDIEKITRFYNRWIMID